MPTPRKLDLELCLAVRDACTAHALRKATRAISALYDDALRPAGVRISQLSILVALALADEATVSRLAGMLVLDRTTLTRNLAPLERRRLVVTVSGVDARHRGLRLTENGRAVLSAALPVWQQVQSRVIKELGGPQWKRLLQGLKAATAVGTARNA
jgi:DNA-binding MarR family transcriptional regulator